MISRPTRTAFVSTKTLLGDAIGLAAICVMVLVGLTAPGVF